MSATMFEQQRPKRMIPLFVSFLLVIFAAGCEILERQSDDFLLARAYDSRLYLEDIPWVVSEGSSPGDSVAQIRRYIDSWVRRQVFLHHALQSDAIDGADLHRRVENYRQALISYDFEKYLVNEIMDTSVTDAEILQYFEHNRDYFTLRDHIVQVTYVKLPLNAPDQHQVRNWYRSDREEDLVLLEAYCVQHASTFFIGKEDWRLFSDIERDMPIRANNPASYLRNNRFSELTDNYYRYFLYIHDYRLKGDGAPLAFEQGNIKTLILNQRKRNFLLRKRGEFFSQAVEARQVEVYY